MTIPPAVLPRLSGVWLNLFRLAFGAVFALALASAVGNTWYDAGKPRLGSAELWSGAQYGLGLRIFPPIPGRGWRVVRAFSAEASAAGLGPNEDIVGLNGQAITRASGYERFSQLIDAREGRRAVFTVRARDGALHSRAVTWRAANVDAWYRGSGLDPWRQTMARRLAYDLMTLLLLTPATILFLRRQRDVVAAMFGLALGLLSIGSTLEFWTATGHLGIYKVLSNIPYILLLMVGCAFPDGRFWPRWTRYGLVAVPLISAPAIALISSAALFPLYAAPAFLALLAILTLRYRSLPAGAERQQFRWVAFGLAATVALLLLRFVLVWPQASLPLGPLSPWGDFFASLVHALGNTGVAFGVAIALLRFRLYDAESLIGRSFAVGATSLILAGVWGGSEKAIEIVFSGLLGEGEEGVIRVIGAGVAVILVTPLHGRMHRWMEKRFRSAVWELRERLPERLAALSQRVGLRALGDTVLAQVTRDVRVARAALVLLRNDRLVVAAHVGANTDEACAGLSLAKLPRAGERVDEATPFPYRLALGEDEEATAWLLLGPRPDGTPCNHDERTALAELAAPLAQAIATTEARDERDNRVDAALRGLEARLAAIEAGAPRPRPKTAPRAAT